MQVKKVTRKGLLLLEELCSKEPKSYADVMTSWDTDQWKQAIVEELESIEANYTWTLVDLPPGRKAIGLQIGL